MTTVADILSKSPEYKQELEQLKQKEHSLTITMPGKTPNEIAHYLTVACEISDIVCTKSKGKNGVIASRLCQDIWSEAMERVRSKK